MPIAPGILRRGGAPYSKLFPKLERQPQYEIALLTCHVTISVCGESQQLRICAARLGHLHEIYGFTFDCGNETRSHMTSYSRGLAC